MPTILTAAALAAGLLLAACSPPMLLDAPGDGPVVQGPVAVPVAPRAAPRVPPPAAQSPERLPQCASREAILDHLAARWHEAPIAMGITSSGGLLEVLSSPAGATWTIIVSAPGGSTCIVSTGEGWRSLIPVPQGPAI